MQKLFGSSIPGLMVVIASTVLFTSNSFSQIVRSKTPEGELTTTLRAPAPPACGFIYTIAGNGIKDFNGDGLATNVSLNWPEGLAVASNGNVYVADSGNDRVRMMTPEGVLTTIAGDGLLGNFNDGVPALNASLSKPHGLALDSLGNLYIADSGTNRVRKVSPDGVITTVAGNGDTGYGPYKGNKGVDAKSVSMTSVSNVAVDSAGNLFVGTAQSVFKITNGKISDFFNIPNHGIALDPEGNLFVSLWAGSSSSEFNKTMIVKVLPDGQVAPVAGNGKTWWYGDAIEGDATSVSLYSPTGLAFDHFGNLYFAGGNSIWKVSKGMLSVLVVGASKDSSTFLGDGQPALGASISGVWFTALDTAGNLYISDTENHRIRKIYCAATMKYKP
ncbi:MAG: hypothetical protein U1F66_11675 [bacterium]